VSGVGLSDVFGQRPDSCAKATDGNATGKDRLKEAYIPRCREELHFHFRFHPAPHFLLALHFELDRQ
jgi:hypothetical protein